MKILPFDQRSLLKKNYSTLIKLLTLIMMFIYNSPSAQSIDKNYDQLVMKSGEIKKINMIKVCLTARCIKEKVYINWIVEGTKDECLYYIERSYDGENFDVIFIKEGPKTNISQNIRFSYIDQKPGKGKVFYRLLEYTNNKEIKYSRIIPVENNEPSYEMYNAEPKRLIS